MRRGFPSKGTANAQPLWKNPQVVFVAVIILLLVIMWRSGSTTGSGQRPAPAVVECGSAPYWYSIMMDAGSTGSRTHVYKFERSSAGDLHLVDEVFKELKPGLSSFPNDPAAAAASLVPLMDIAVNSVPAAYVSCTTVALKATAGLRLLGDAKSQAILNSVSALLRRYPFVVGKDAAVVMDGSDEGPFAWLTVNFLLGNLVNGKQTAAILDMGGGSTQIVFQPDDSSVLDKAPAANRYTAALRGSDFKAYQHSYLGLGLKEAGKSIVKAWAASSNPTAFVCFPSSYTEKVGDVVVANDDGTNQRFDACLRHVSKTLINRDAPCDVAPCAFNSVYQPSLDKTFSGNIYAFSYFYDRMEDFLPDNGKITVGTFREVGTKICENTGQEYAAKNKGTECMDFAFLYSMLSVGYGLPDERPLFIKKKINGIETAWALGASLVSG